MSEAVASSDASIAERVKQLIAADEVQLPPLPEVSIRVQEILSSDGGSTKDLGELLAQDPAIVTSLMRLANSASFGGMGRIENLSAAVQRIGLREVGAIVTGISLKGHFRAGSGDKLEVMQTLWDHSVTTAFSARAIARKMKGPAETAFLAGLLHDCGKVLVLTAVDRLEEQGMTVELPRETLLELMNTLHCEVGHRVLTEWSLPDEVAEVAWKHHEFAHGAEDLMLSVQAGNLVTKKLGFHLEPDPALQVLEEPVIDELGLDDLTIATLMVDMEDHLEEMRSLF